VNIRKSIERRHRKKRLVDKTSKTKEKHKPDKRVDAWIMENEEEEDVEIGENDNDNGPDEKSDHTTILDFLDPHASQFVVTTNPETSRSSSAHWRLSSTTTSPSFALSEDGRFIIPDEESEEDEDETTTTTSQQPTLPSDPSNTTSTSSVLGKRKRSTSDEKSSANTNEDNQTIPLERVMKRQKRSTTTTARYHFTGHNGEEFRSSKASGDMKRAGRPDPYAYLPLNPRMLNKRRRLHAYKQFENVIKAAKRGAKAKRKKKKITHKKMLDKINL
jgi:ribosomal RNA-processing protein 12